MCVFIYRIKVSNEDNRDILGLQTNFNTDVADSYSPPVVENIDTSDSQKNKVNKDINKFYVIIYYYKSYYKY